MQMPQESRAGFGRTLSSWNGHVSALCSMSNRRSQCELFRSKDITNNKPVKVSLKEERLLRSLWRWQLSQFRYYHAEFLMPVMQHFDFCGVFQCDQLISTSRHISTNQSANGSSWSYCRCCREWFDNHRLYNKLPPGQGYSCDQLRLISGKQIGKKWSPFFFLDGHSWSLIHFHRDSYTIYIYISIYSIYSTHGFPWIPVG